MRVYALVLNRCFVVVYSRYLTMRISYKAASLIYPMDSAVADRYRSHSVSQNVHC